MCGHEERVQTPTGRAQKAHQEEVVVLGVGTQVLEDRLLPELLHVCPVVDLAVAHGVRQLVHLRVRHRFVADVKVKIFNAYRM